MPQTQIISSNCTVDSRDINIATNVLFLNKFKITYRLPMKLRYLPPSGLFKTPKIPFAAAADNLIFLKEKLT